MQSFFSKNLVLDTPQAMGKLQKQELGGTNTTNNNKMDAKRGDKKDGDNNGTNDDGNDDDDDFDIRDYHNPIAGANFKLRLHPFGNMVDFDNKGESKKFNLQTRRNVFNNNKLDPKLAAASRTTRSVPHPPHRDGQDAVASSLPSSTRESPLRLSKYSDPLPPITSGDRKKPKTPKVPDATSVNVQNGGQLGNIGVVGEELTVESGSTVAHTSDDREAKTQRSDQNAGLSQSEVEKEKTKCAEDMPKLTRRKTLILPPIETSKEMVHNKN
ncbi:hypothetical protein EGW08_018969 [Elysia chlorotica]|uniref:Uncharacterized protein n=1 Tax=Elysia chlorotica TaxID=188477 RepID=A0A433SVH6_ELYCH|nr:hypothetical protein EGW08_018969 [Elysia chlorotica]